LLLEIWVGHAAAGPDQPARPGLAIAAGVPAEPDGQVEVPLTFRAGGAEIASLAFSIDYDGDLLVIDPTDADGDGSPDAVAFDLPGAFVTIVSLDPADTDGELDIVITDLIPPLARLPDGEPVRLTFDVGRPPAPETSPVRFSSDPPPSFGSTTGGSVPGMAEDGSVRIGTGPAALVHLPLLFRNGP
jgi:hypothetical protein